VAAAVTAAAAKNGDGEAGEHGLIRMEVEPHTNVARDDPKAEVIIPYMDTFALDSTPSAWLVRDARCAPVVCAAPHTLLQ